MKPASLGLRGRLIGLVLLGSLPLAILLVDWALALRDSAASDLAITVLTAGIGILAGALHGMWRSHVARKHLVAESDRKLDAVTANVPGVIYQVWRRADGAVTYPFFSNYVGAICGAAPQEVVREPSRLFDRLGFRDAAARERVVSPPSDAPRRWREEVSYAAPSGRTGWLSVEATARPAPDGGVIWDCIAMDVTDAKCLEDRLRATEFRLTDAIESISEGFVLWDAADRLVMCNSRYRAIYGLSGDIFVPGISFEATLRAGLAEGQFGDVGDPEAWIAGTLDMRRAAETLSEHCLGDGSWVQARERRTADGGMVGIHADITDLKTKEFELCEVRDRLEQQAQELVGLAENYACAKSEADMANRAKSEFLTGMSHELRTPLNAILGFSQLIGSVDFGPTSLDRFRSYAGNIHASGEHLLSLINDLLDLSKVEAGKMELQEDDVELRQLLTGVETMMRERAARAGITLSVVGSGHQVIVRADALKLKQSVLNLISNALKFTPEGGKIGLLLEDDAQGVAITVADTGIGIKPEDLPKVFDKFGQIDGSLSRRHRGTGLGMPLTKTFIEMHGGSVELESVVGCGTRVTIRLPQARRLALAS